MTPMKAIRAKCLDCCGEHAKEVRLCPCENCSLHPFRLGRNPNIKLTDEQRAKRTEYLKKSPSYKVDSEIQTVTEGNYIPVEGGG